jgi:hypothetical protein
MREKFFDNVDGHTITYIHCTPCWALERRYRGLGDLNACNFSDVKEGWPGMVIDHVIIPGTSGSGPIKARYVHFENVQFCYIEGEGGEGGVGGGIYMIT